VTKPEAVRLTREMHEAGWSNRRIHSYLASHGVKVHNRTVDRWSDPEKYEKSLERQRAYERARNGSTQPRVADADALRSRAAQLCNAGLDARGIAIVLGVDFDVHPSTQAVGELLRTGEFSPRFRRAVTS
jgi:hypothetical protein